MKLRDIENPRCPRCGTPGTFASGDDLCPGCLLEAALDPGEVDHEDASTFETCGIYQLERILGRGGTGVVFLARKPGDPAPVALKMLAAARLAGPDELRRFRLESEAAMELEHPNIVRILDSGTEDGTPWFVMDHAPGGSLADLLLRETDKASLQSGLRERVALLANVARAVHHAHERGILHRDIKPANILISGEGIPWVADFGLARLIHDPAGVTMTGAALGTPGYMAPEQAKGNSITTAADVYSLGAVLFHLIAGSPPFDSPTPLETLRLVTSQDAPDPRSLAPWLDHDLTMVCQKALRRERTARYGSAADLADDLDAWLRGDAVKARPLSLSEKTLRWCRHHPIAVSLSAATAVAMLVLALVLVTGSLMLREERNQAVHQEFVARTHAHAATLARDQSRLHSYAADMYLAFRAFDDGHLGLARRMLARQIPQGALPDLRGFEWHALSRRCRGDDLKSWHEHQGAVRAVAFSPDGKRLASASRDGLLVIRSVPDGSALLSLPKPGAPHGAAEIPLMASVTSRSAEAKKLILTAKLNPDDLRLRARPSKLGEISALAWSPDGSLLATAGLGSFVRVWSMPAGELTGIIPIRTVNSLAFTPDGRFLITHLQTEGNEDRHECRIHQTAGLAEIQVISNLHPAHAVSPVDGSVATVAFGGTDIYITDAATGRRLIELHPGMPLKRLAFSADGRVLHGVDFQGTTCGSWSLDGGARTGIMFPVAGTYDLLAASPCGRFFASTGAAQRIVWQHADGNSAAMLLGGHEDVIRALAVSPDGDFLASGGNDHSVRLWSTRPAQEQATAGDPFLALDPADALLRAAPSPALIARTANGHWICTKDVGGELRLVSHEGEVLRSLTAPAGPIHRLVASADAKTLAVFSWPRGLRLLDAGGASWSKEWILSSGTVGPIVFSPDGSLLVSGGDDNMISIRDAKTGGLRAQLKGHQNTLTALAFSPDGRTLASTAEDKTLRLWHCATWRDLGILHRGELMGRLAFDDAGNLLHVRTENGTRSFGMSGP